MSGPLLAGRYRLQQSLGRGALAVVWQAFDEPFGRPVAVKIFDAAPHVDLSRLHAAGALAHPNIVAVHDIGLDDGTPFVVMELSEGFSLATVLAEGPLPVADAAAVGVQVCQALEAAHAAGIVHGGIKPANILIGDGGVVKVGDFGIADLADPYDPGADMYLLGRLLQAMVAGSPEGKSAFGELVDQLLDTERGTRLTAAQVRERLLSGSGPKEGEGPDGQSRLLRVMLISGAATLVVVIAMCVWFLLPRSPAMHQADALDPAPISPTGAATPSPTSSPEPDQTPAAATGTGVAAVRSVIKAQLDAGQIKPDAARDLNDRLDEIARHLSKGQKRQAGSRLRAMRNQLDAMRRDNRVTADGYDAIRSALTQLGRSI